MARYTYEMAHIKAEQLFKHLCDAEEYYINSLEKIMLREHFQNGYLKPSANLSSISKLELSIAFKRLQNAFIDYTIMKHLERTLKENGSCKNVK